MTVPQSTCLISLQIDNVPHYGYVWHITHRCHKKDFLLKFDKDKSRSGLPREIDEVKNGAHLTGEARIQKATTKKPLSVLRALAVPISA